MKIYFWPSRNDDNMYIDNMLGGLRHVGVENVNTPKQSLLGKLFVITLALLNPTVKTFHFNWIENFSIEYTRKSSIKLVLLDFMLCIGKFLGKKFVWTMHNAVPHKCKNQIDVNNAEVFLKKWIGNMDMVVIHSKETRTILEKKYNYPFEKILFVPHGKYEYVKISDKERADFRYQLGIKKNEIVYECLGLIDEYKNIPMLIKAFQEISIPNVKLMICGKYAKNLSEESKAIIKKAGDYSNIILIDRFIENEEIPFFLNSADIMVFPYNKKSMQNSGAAILAMSYYKPLIVSEFGYIKDIMHYPFVFSYDYDDEMHHYEALKKALQESYAEFFDERDRATIAEQEKKYVDSELDWDAICVKIAARYKGLSTLL